MISGISLRGFGSHPPHQERYPLPGNLESPRRCLLAQEESLEFKLYPGDLNGLGREHDCKFKPLEDLERIPLRGIRIS